MTPLYLAAHPVEAEIVRQYLAVHGVSARVAGEFAWSARGEIPVDAWPRLLLDDERDREHALALIRQYQHQRDGRAWCCARCREASPEHFAFCWNCEAPAPA